MKTTAIAAGALALLATILSPVFFMSGTLAEAPMKLIMFVASAVWFATAPIWMNAR